MGEWIELQAADGFKAKAWKATPQGAPKGGIVVIQEIFGVNHHIRSVADRFAAAGYLAIAPGMFDRVERDVELGYDQAGMTEGMGIAGKLDRHNMSLDVAAAVCGRGGRPARSASSASASAAPSLGFRRPMSPACRRRSAITAAGSSPARTCSRRFPSCCISARRTITGMQNGLASRATIMSARSAFLASRASSSTSGFDGTDLLHRLAGRLAGGRCFCRRAVRNLGKYTFADVCVPRSRSTWMRLPAAIGTLTVVAFYLIAQMVGAGSLIKLLFGLGYLSAVVIVGTRDDRVRRSSAACSRQRGCRSSRPHFLLVGATVLALLVLSVRYQPSRCSPTRREVIGAAMMPSAPGQARRESSRHDLARHGPHVRHRRTAAHPHAVLHRSRCQAAPQSVSLRRASSVLSTAPTFILGFGAIARRLRSHQGGGQRRQLGRAAPGASYLAAVRRFAWLHLGGDIATILAVVAGLTPRALRSQPRSLRLGHRAWPRLRAQRG